MAIDTQLNRQAQALLAERRYQEAAALCIDGLAKAPDDPELLLTLARCDEATGDLEGAVERLTKAVALDGQYTLARFHLGRLLATRGQQDAALACFDQCIADDPNHAAARTLRARLLAARGDRQQAIGELKTALRADPEDVLTMTTLAELLLAEGQLEPAHAQAAAAVRARPDLASVQMTMAQVLIAQNHVDFARQCLDNAVEAAPTDPRPRLLQARLLHRQGQFQAALQVLGEIDHHVAIVAERSLLEARCLRELGRSTDALQRLAVLAERPGAPVELVLEAAECALEAGAVEQAGEWLQQPGLQGKPRATLLEAYRLEQLGEAVSAAELALSLHSGQDPAIEQAARMLSARLAMREKDAEAALACLSPMLDRSDVAPPVVWLAARLSLAQAQPEQSIAWLEKLLARKELDDGVRARSHLALAQMLDELGQHAEAADHLKPGAWRRPFLGFESQADREWDQEFMQLDPWPFAREAPDNGRFQPILLAGWPGSGREFILSALIASRQLSVLAPAGWADRRERLGLPATLTQVMARADSEVRLDRRRYLRDPAAAQAQGFSGLLESGVVVADDLPLLARLFPGASVILPKADLADLEIHWRLNGFTDVDGMSAAWKRDHRRLEQLLSRLPLNKIEVKLDRLMARPEAALATLCEALGLGYTPAMLSALDDVHRQVSYRAPGHWQHYHWTV